MPCPYFSAILRSKKLLLDQIEYCQKLQISSPRSSRESSFPARREILLTSLSIQDGGWRGSRSRTARHSLLPLFQSRTYPQEFRRAFAPSITTNPTRRAHSSWARRAPAASCAPPELPRGAPRHQPRR